MAQAVSHDDIHLLWSQAKAGKKLTCPATDNMSIVGQLGARDLTIVWADHKRYWKWTTMEIGGQCVKVAELIQVCWLEIDGKYSMQKLTEGINYEVKFLVKLSNDFNIDKPVKFSLTTSDGCKQDRNENMMGMPRNQILGISAGEFQAQKARGCGEIKFSMMNTDGFWKNGLVVIGALIVPSNDAQSLFAQAIQGKKLIVPAMQNKMVKQQLPPQMNLPVVGHLVARDLSIIWSDDSRYWKWKTMEICNGRSIDVAELLDVCWLKIDGKYKVQELTEGMHYKVMFVVKLLHNLNINKPVIFSLTTPDGSKQEHTKNMMDMPINQIIGITAGEFQTKACGCGPGEINFTMMNTDGFWKRGMVVIGTLLLPKD